MLTCTFEHGATASLRHVTIDALIIQDGKVLMVKRAKHLNEGGKWALVGGFVERDETIEQAVQREVMEEAGYEINQLKLFLIRDNPGRPHEDRQNISFVYTCNAIKKVAEHDDEVDEVKWFDLDELPPDDQIAFDHADDLAKYKMSIV